MRRLMTGRTRMNATDVRIFARLLKRPIGQIYGEGEEAEAPDAPLARRCSDRAGSGVAAAMTSLDRT